jgi:hypothetical protein
VGLTVGLDTEATGKFFASAGDRTRRICDGETGNEWSSVSTNCFADYTLKLCNIIAAPPDTKMDESDLKLNKSST